MKSTDLLARLEQSFSDAVEPVRKDLADVDEEIAKLETELHRLRALRTRGRQLLRTLDPDAPEVQTHRSEPGPGPMRQNGKPYAISEQKLTALADWLEEHREELEGELLAVTTVMERPDFALMSHQTLNVALQVSADRGLIRLDHVDAARGGRRVYMLNPKVATE